MLTALSIVIAAATILYLKTNLKWRRANPQRLPFPPGPTPQPLLGNARDIPKSYYWLTYSDWTKKYGDVIHMEAFGKHFVILNSLEAIEDLLEKRSAIYSDRPRLPMLNELMGWSWALSRMHYGPRWRKLHRIFHQYFHSGVIQSYHETQLREARRTIGRLIDTPDEFKKHVRRFFSATILKIAYGIELDESNSSYIEVAEESLRGVAAAGVPGAFLVDIIPIMKYIPEWFPGATFQKKARRWRELMPRFVNAPFEEAKGAKARGIETNSIVSAALERGCDEAESDPDFESNVRDVAAITFAAGADTTVSTMELFFLTMMLHPNSQRKAQEQIDSVVGRDRLPTFDDLEHIPYIRAIVLEIMRWQPVTPLAVAHSVLDDDVYRGYYIPKGAVVTGNSWAILHDKDIYYKPHEFIPERFLHEDGSYNSSTMDPRVVSFGFGRRKCPGRHLALNGAMITAASLLACFNITRKAEDETEYVLNDPTKPIMTTGSISYPLPFKCDIHPRSESTVGLVKQVLKVPAMHTTELYQKFIKLMTVGWKRVSEK